MRRSITYLAQQHTAIILILIAFLGLGVTYSIVNPLFEASDEPWHYPVVREIAEGRGLPVVHPGEGEPWRQEGTQPPLYYALSAAATFWLDTSDMEEVLWRNPHATIGVPLAYDNKNMIIHTDRERFPWHGSVLAVHLIRFLSVLLGAGTVFLTWRLGHELEPGCPEVALAAAVLVAFNPMFLFITGSVNNDNLAVLLGTLAVWLLVRILRSGVTQRRLVALSLLLGLGAITKLSLLGLLPLATVTLAYIAWRQRMSLGPLIRWCLTLLGMVMVIAAWWYVRNWQLYGDPLALNVHLDVMGRRAFVPDWRKLLGEWEGFRISYWGLFGGVNVLAPGAMYKAFDILSLMGLLGLLLAVWRLWRDRQRGSLVSLALLAAWVITVLVSLIRWTRLTPASQGRLMFPAIAAISILLASGLLALVPRCWRSLTVGVLSLGMATWAAILPFVVIAPAYAPPPLLADLPSDALPLRVDFGGQAQLLGYEMPEDSVRPGERLPLTLYWQAVVSMDRDYSVFIHLVDDNGLIVAQRDSYPAGGNGITSRWPVGSVVPDHHIIQVPAIAPAPCQTRLRIGLYDAQSGTRLPTADGGDSVSLGTVSVVPAEGAVGLPNPVYFDFEGKLALVGFDLDRRVVHPGETLHVTLYWLALLPMEEDYTVFTHLLLPPDQVWAQEDDQPQDGQSPTSTWQPGLIIEDYYQLTLPVEAPFGVYEIEVGLYSPATGDRLKVGLSDAGIVLGKVKVQR